MHWRISEHLLTDIAQCKDGMKIILIILIMSSIMRTSMIYVNGLAVFQKGMFIGGKDICEKI